MRETLIDEKTKLPLSMVAVLILGTAWAIRLEARVDRAIQVEQAIASIQEDVVDIKIHMGIPLKHKKQGE